MDQASPTQPDADLTDADPAPKRDWSRWAVFGVLGCLGLALMAAIPPVVVAWIALRPGGSGEALVEARRIVDESVRDARIDPRVTSALGQPIRTRRRTLSSDFDLAGGDVDAVVELRGPEGEGQLHLRLQRVYGRWRIEEVRFEELKAHAVDLLEPPRRGVDPYAGGDEGSPPSRRR